MYTRIFNHFIHSMQCKQNNIIKSAIKEINEFLFFSLFDQSSASSRNGKYLYTQWKPQLFFAKCVYVCAECVCVSIAFPGRFQLGARFSYVLLFPSVCIIIWYSHTSTVYTHNMWWPQQNCLSVINVNVGVLKSAGSVTRLWLCLSDAVTSHIKLIRQTCTIWKKWK